MVRGEERIDKRHFILVGWGRTLYLLRHLRFISLADVVQPHHFVTRDGATRETTKHYRVIRQQVAIRFTKSFNSDLVTEHEYWMQRSLIRSRARTISSCAGSTLLAPRSFPFSLQNVMMSATPRVLSFIPNRVLKLEAMEEKDMCVSARSLISSSFCSFVSLLYF